MPNKALNILFHFPNPDTIYAGRTIYNGYKHAFEDLGHNFRTLTPDSNYYELFEKFKPDIFITSLGPLNLKFLDLDLVSKQKKRGMKVFVNVPFWHTPFSKLRINETLGLSSNKEYIKLIKSGKFGDVYYNVCEQNDPRMDGFEKITGYKYETILLAADKTINFHEYLDKYKSDISFIGTLLPGKVNFFQNQVYPLKNKYNVKLYGQDWTYFERITGFIQKVGQYFNIPIIKSIKKPKLELEDERKIYSSSIISINVHEDYQRKFGLECNERTFKIPLCGGFEISDNVACIRKYLRDGKEIVIAKDKDDWFDKIDYYMKNQNKRLPIIEAGRKKVLNEHTYHNRVNQMIHIFKSLK